MTRRDLGVVTGRLAMAVVVLAGATSPAWPQEPPAEKAAVVAADEALAAAVATGDREAFRALLADEALFLGGGVSRGRVAILASWAPLLDPDSGIQLEWAPDQVRVASSGDLAYTVGEYRMTRRDSAGDLVVTEGIYVTVWGRGGDGRWRVLVDAGSPPSAATP